MPCSTKFNINHSADISVYDAIESSTSSKPENVVSNPTCEDFFDNCSYHDQKNLFDSLAYYLSELERSPDVNEWVTFACDGTGPADESKRTKRVQGWSRLNWLGGILIIVSWHIHFDKLLMPLSFAN